MKRVLITGKGSYVGIKVEQWLSKAGYEVEVLDMIEDTWKSFDFHDFDSVYHVAGIAHVDINNVSEERKKLYYKVNCSLAVDTAIKAKRAGVKQFIYMSSLLVYGDSGTSSYTDKRCIERDSNPNPSNFYGDSKWQAELKLRLLESDDFHVAIIRSPMIYGKNCKGNYNAMKSIALKTPFFPDYPNERSILFIGNLCEFIRLLVESGKGGVYWPQNEERIKTSDFIREIGKAHGRKVHINKRYNWLIPVSSHIPGKIKRLVNKAFGSLVVNPELSKTFDGKYRIFSFEESIKETERRAE